MQALTNNSIQLKPLSPEISEQLFELTDRNRTYLKTTLPWLDGVKVVNDTKKFIEDFQHKESEEEGMAFGIWYEENLVGVIDFHEISKSCKSAQIGYWIDEKHQRKGIVTEACKMLIKYGFDTLDLHRIEIHCATENPNSAAIAKRLGFIKEGVLRESTILYRKYQDMELYSLLRKEVAF